MNAYRVNFPPFFLLLSVIRERCPFQRKLFRPPPGARIKRLCFKAPFYGRGGEGYLECVKVQLFGTTTAAASWSSKLYGWGGRKEKLEFKILFLENCSDWKNEQAAFIFFFFKNQFRLTLVWPRLFVLLCSVSKN